VTSQALLAIALLLAGCPRFNVDPGAQDKLLPGLAGAVFGSAKGIATHTPAGDKNRSPAVALSRAAVPTPSGAAWESPHAVSVRTRAGGYLGCWNCVPDDPHAVFRRGGQYGVDGAEVGLWSPEVRALVCDSDRSEDKPELRAADGGFLGCVDGAGTGCGRDERFVRRRVEVICGGGGASRSP